MGCCFSSTSGEDGGVELSLASAPSIKISAHDTCNCMTEYKDECNVLTSYGLDDTSLAAAFANTCLEQDRSYWEIHLRTNLPPTSRLVVGLSKKMKANSISSLCEKLLSDPNPMPFENQNEDKVYAVAIPDLKKGDSIGVCFDQNDLPQIVFRVNGEITSHHVQRVKGSVYPFVAWKSGTEEKATAVSMVFRGDKFKNPLPPKFGIVIAATSLI
ncbi:hypothetical protein TrLO_g2874 [Triparma laevis f. longispina]|uniref:SPRY domain-containing protein n=1 Tax=Triparma laevis f. longispina TaxID=1714387 RepID=A0A9W7CB10_9STRA|nr:hypothetical protein TrLO_g2874 [Triparma laevis f. longispina]